MNTREYFEDKAFDTGDFIDIDLQDGAGNVVTCRTMTALLDLSGY